MDRVLKTDAFSLLELNVKHAVASVLNKPQWWSQWHESAVREQWLAENRAELLRKTFDECLLWTQKEDSVTPSLSNLMKLAQEPFSAEKEAREREWCRFVRYESTLDTPALPGMNAYLCIQWRLAMGILQEELASIPVQDWSLELIEPLVEKVRTRDGFEVCARSHAFLHLILRSPKDVTAENVQTALGGRIESRRKVVELLRPKCHEIRREVAGFEEYVIEKIDFYAKHHLTSVRFEGDTTARLSPAGIHCIWISDAAIPASLKAEFVKKVDELEREVLATEDWGSETSQELELIDPSLFCCIFGTTKQVSQPISRLDASFKDLAEQMATLMFSVADRVMALDHDLFQWIPSEFQIQEDDGAMRIRSYINNLHPVRHAAMYTSIEAIFSRFVPLFERVLSGLPDPELSPSFSIPSSNRMEGCRPGFPDSAHGEGDVPTLRVDLRGNTAQVAVKLTEIRLTPDSPEYRGGSWHIEGTNAENIVATGIYCCASENIKEESTLASRLSFRVLIEEPEFAPDDHQGVALMFGLEHGDRLVQRVGSVSTFEDRCLAFPNGLQHKLEPFELEDRTKPGVLKILAFFLVDPEDTISSTSVIPPQQQTWINEAQEPILKKMRLVDAAESKIREMVCSQEGMSLDAARAYCLELAEGKAFLNNPDPDDSDAFFALWEN